MPVTAAELVAGVALDLAFGDPQWLPHPVRGVGCLAHKAEPLFRATRMPTRLTGAAFAISVVAVTTAAVSATVRFAKFPASVYWIYSFLACRDLDFEASRVIRALNRGDYQTARKNLSLIVGRDTAALDEREMVRAVVETVAENLSDGVVAPLFYLAFAGPAGMAAYKAVNTLDSMVGHRNERYREFGWASARLDDVMNYVPARVTAALIATASLLPSFHARRAVGVTLRDGASQPSPNAGYPEAAMAGALGVQLGGTNYYAGVPSRKAPLGDAAIDLNRAVFPRVRVLLYISEALFVGIILGWRRWR